MAFDFSGSWKSDKNKGMVSLHVEWTVVDRLVHGAVRWYHMCHNNVRTLTTVTFINLKVKLHSTYFKKNIIPFYGGEY